MQFGIHNSQFIIQHSAFIIALMWPQPLDPFGVLPLSALAAAVPLGVLLVLMGGLRKSGALAAAWGFATACLLAILVWRMPVKLAALSAGFGVAFAHQPNKKGLHHAGLFTSSSDAQRAERAWQIFSPK